ncbi:MAG: hypothetical protein NTW96_00465 [Planctomycetia bacterium]|nr:hypothetical protein [Planctomycetia bacterium]
MTLDELINIEYRPAAVAVLRETGHLTPEQDWADITPDLADTLAKKPGPFWAAVKAKYFTL